MCSGGGSAPKPPAPPPAVNQAPDEIANAVDSNAAIRKKQKKGTKSLRRASTGVQAAGESAGSGLTISN